MRYWVSILKQLRADRRAATAVEYCLIAAMIVLAMFAGLQAVGSTTADMWNNVSTKIVNAR